MEKISVPHPDQYREKYPDHVVIYKGRKGCGAYNEHADIFSIVMGSKIEYVSSEKRYTYHVAQSGIMADTIMEIKDAFYKKNISCLLIDGGKIKLVRTVVRNKYDEYFKLAEKTYYAKQSETNLQTPSYEDYNNTTLSSIETSDDDENKQNCNNCKYYRNDNCCGKAAICDEYVGVPSVDFSSAPKEGDASRYRRIYGKKQLENPYTRRKY